MQKVIGKLKIGSRVILGAYTAGTGTPVPVVWLKATPNCDFISEFALDFLCFDAIEPMSRADGGRRNFGDSRYLFSNILSFANSEQEQWYTPMHAYDAAPDKNRNRVITPFAAYTNHEGFLYHFDDYEIASIISATYIVDAERVRSLIRLPTAEEIVGAGRLNIFNTRGVRPKPTNDLINNKPGIKFDYTSYLPFWCADANNNHVKFIDRSVCVKSQLPAFGCGFRPICTINPDAAIDEVERGVWRLTPFRISDDKLCTDNELLELLGLSLPTKAS